MEFNRVFCAVKTKGGRFSIEDSIEYCAWVVIYVKVQFGSVSP